MDEKRGHKQKPVSPDPAPGSGTGRWPGHLIVILVLAAFLGAIYAPALPAPFLFDDQMNITANPYIRITRLDAAQIQRAVVQDKFQLRPLSNLSFALDYYLNGLNRPVMRAENVVLHAVCAVLLYFIVLALIPLAVSSGGPKEKKFMPRERQFVAGLAALVWAAHPAQVQAVTYLVQRQTELAVAGVLAAFLAYHQARLSPDPRKKIALYLVAAAAFLIGAGAKEIGWTLPLLLLGFEFALAGAPNAPARSRRLIIALALFLAAAGSLGAVVLIATGILPAYLESYQKLGYGVGARLLTEARVVWSYLITMFFPFSERLALDHDIAVSRSLLSPWTTIPAGLALVGLVGAGVWAGRRRPLLTFLTLGFVIALLPESSLIPVELMYDHRIYFYSLFILPPATAGVALTIGPRRALPLLIVIALMLGALTVSRNQTFRSAAAVWRDSAKKSPGLARPWSNLCAALLEERDFSRALLACERASALDPKLATPAVNRGIALMNLGQKDAAMAALAEAVKRDGSSALARYNYGYVLELAGQDQAALREYEAALTADTFHLLARLGRARLLEKSGQRDEALAELKLCVKLFPDSAEARALLDALQRNSP